MTSLLLSVIASASAFYISGNPIYFSLIAVGIYYLFRKSSKSATMTYLNFILISAVGILGKTKGFHEGIVPGLMYLSLGTAAGVVYDLIKRWYGLIPMLALTGIGIGYVATEKFGQLGFAFGLLVVPVLLRELYLQRKSEGVEK
ncbi:hypothetical protein [Fervidobacterium thailandense]|uniref:Uncharacterized protein n=1 Tax=Fervidobacterium thailandense TaxID=1008305 RepID=A0A1E3G1Q4_9BACT|nr:hypothetical protein [Fervidobacterium thailandense]ODN30199.1 hypothetical protein A4H02_06450 [Fervidobacterium thailandense]